jgi:NAD(P)-dependent dehydrogenase (short-subunit alcohol dehydrogenase family)
MTSNNRVALITGGARGIGLGIAKSLAADGYSLALNGVRAEDQVVDVLTAFRDSGTEVIYCQGDVGSAADRASIIQKVKDEFGRLDVLINNAGITSPGRKDLLEADEESFDRVVAVNLKGPYFLTQLAANFMIELQDASLETEPCIVNVSSISAEFVSTNRGDYCLTKAATGMATKLWATRLADFGIRVYEIQPGIIRSDMTSGVTEKYDRMFKEGLALEKRWGEPEDIGRAVAALVRGEIPYATGQVLYLDGGMRIPRL